VATAAEATTKESRVQSDTATAIRLMEAFAERTGLGSVADAVAARTGLGSAAAPQRYLWTDAFALLDALALHRKTGEARWRQLASDLVAQVHGVLGRHRPDDTRTGWLSELSEEEGARHPTRGGLRIGKPLPERGPDQRCDERLEWERDGQYWHYLTKWMDALSRAAVILGEPRYQAHAIELAEAVFPRFLQSSTAGTPVGVAWKMSVDLSRPQVAGISPHDALDGCVTFRWLGRSGAPTGLAEAAAMLCRLAAGRDWATADPLGLGGLLLDAFRLALLPDRTLRDERLIGAILAGADAGLQHFLAEGALALPPERRLGFRELGLAIGLQAVPAIAAAAGGSPELVRASTVHLDRLRAAVRIARHIEDFWASPENQRAHAWTDHRDINEVMLASALLDACVETARRDET
jgi:hypothetical protein